MPSRPSAVDIERWNRWARENNRPLWGANEVPGAPVAAGTWRPGTYVRGQRIYAVRTNGQDMEHNADIVKKRATALQNQGAFRDEVPQKNKFERSFTPRFGDKVHQVSKIEGNIVTDQHGKEFSTRHVLPVAQGSTDIDTTGMRGGSERIDRVRLQALEPYRQRITEFVGEGKTENEVVRFMKTLGMDVLMNAGFNFRNALQLLGFTTGTGRGSSTHLVTKATSDPPKAQRPPRTPAEATTALRRRITGKTPA